MIIMSGEKSEREMIHSIFAEKLKEKEEEVECISQKIKEVQNALQMVRYGAVTNMSSQTQIHGPQSENFLPSIHPAASVLTQGKRPREQLPDDKTAVKVKIEQEDDDDPLTSTRVVPVYVPPKPKPG